MQDVVAKSVPKYIYLLSSDQIVQRMELFSFVYPDYAE